MLYHHNRKSYQLHLNFNSTIKLVDYYRECHDFLFLLGSCGLFFGGTIVRFYFNEVTVAAAAAVADDLEVVSVSNRSF